MLPYAVHGVAVVCSCMLETPSCTRAAAVVVCSEEIIVSSSCIIMVHDVIFVLCLQVLSKLAQSNEPDADTAKTGKAGPEAAATAAGICKEALACCLQVGTCSQPKRLSTLQQHTFLH